MYVVISSPFILHAFYPVHITAPPFLAGEPPMETELERHPPGLLKPHHRSLLEAQYKRSRYVNRETCIQLASRLHLSVKQVQYWFQNRRAKDKRTLRRQAMHYNANFLQGSNFWAWPTITSLQDCIPTALFYCRGILLLSSRTQVQLLALVVAFWWGQNFKKHMLCFGCILNNSR